MADLLNLAPATYSRIERNESSIDLDQVVQFAKKLDIPVQEFLPETITLHNTNNQNGQGGIIFGNIYNSHNYHSDEPLTQQLQLKDQENTFLREKSLFWRRNWRGWRGSEPKIAVLRF